jgi:hypothetical protein
MSKLAHMHGERLRQTWQSRVLAAAKQREGAVMVAIAIEMYFDAIHALLHATFDGFKDLSLPALKGYGTVEESGHISCILVGRDRSLQRVAVYDDEDEMINAFRRIADKLKLNDADRKGLFADLQAWVAADKRVDQWGRKKLQ